MGRTMTTYKTGNPIGSTAVKDLYDNAENLDHATNDRSTRVWDDRFGVARRTWYGMEQDFQDFLINSGYQDIGEYGPGLEITARNQIFRREIAPGQFELYRAGANLDLPYTTTGDWEQEGGQFVAVGDQVLRQQLADSTDPENGAGMVGYRSTTVGAALDKLEAESQKVYRPELFKLDSDPDDTLSFIRMMAAAEADGATVVATGEYFVQATDDGIPLNVNVDFSAAIINCDTDEDVAPWWEQKIIFCTSQDFEDVTASITLPVAKGAKNISLIGKDGFLLLESNDVVMDRRDGAAPAVPQLKKEVNIVDTEGQLVYDNYYQFNNLTAASFKPTVSRLDIKLPTFNLTGRIRTTYRTTRNNVNVSSGLIGTTGGGHCQAFIEAQDCYGVIFNGAAYVLNWPNGNQGGYALTYTRSADIEIRNFRCLRGWAGLDGNYTRDVRVLDSKLLTIGGHFSLSDITAERVTFINHCQGQGWGYFKIIDCTHALPDDSTAHQSFRTRPDYANSWDGKVTVARLKLILAAATGNSHSIVQAPEPKFNHNFIGVCPDIEVDGVDIDMERWEPPSSGFFEIRGIDLGVSAGGSFEKYQLLPFLHIIRGVRLLHRSGSATRIDFRPVLNFRNYLTLTLGEVGAVNIHGIYNLIVEDLMITKAGRSENHGMYLVHPFNFDKGGPRQKILINNSDGVAPRMVGSSSEITVNISNAAINFGLADGSPSLPAAYHKVTFSNCTLYSPLVWAQGSNRRAMISYENCHFVWVGNSPLPTGANPNDSKVLGAELNGAPDGTLLRLSGCYGQLENDGVTYNTTFKPRMQNGYRHTGYLT